MRRLRLLCCSRLACRSSARSRLECRGAGRHQDAALARGIAKALSSHGLAGPGTGVAVADLATGEIIYRRNGWRPLLPASTEKLFTTVAALSTLRPTFRFATTVVGAGTQEGSTWNGDLYLVGSGDPTFSSGDVAALASPGQGARHHAHHRAHPRRRDGLRRDALGALAGALHGRRVARRSPAWRSTATSTRRGRDVGSPSHNAARALRKALRKAGVRVDVHFVAGGRAGGRRRSSARVQSDPLWQIVRFMDRHSDNFTAEMVAKAIGAYAGGHGSTARGMHVAGEVAAPMLGDDAARSSTSRTARASRTRIARPPARSRACWPAPQPIRPIAKPLAGALSVAGVNGTLARRLPALRGRVLGKSGTLDNVSALAGYVRAKSGRRYAFAVLMNVQALNDWDAHATQDAIVTVLANR